jgi:hypothetical protein
LTWLYFLLLSPDFAWKHNLADFGLYMTIPFQWSTMLDFFFFYFLRYVLKYKDI